MKDFYNKKYCPNRNEPVDWFNNLKNASTSISASVTSTNISDSVIEWQTNVTPHAVRVLLRIVNIFSACDTGHSKLEINASKSKGKQHERRCHKSMRNANYSSQQRSSMVTVATLQEFKWEWFELMK